MVERSTTRRSFHSAPTTLPRLEQLHLDGATVLISVAVVIATSALFTILPTMVLRLDLVSGFRGARGATRRGQRPFGALIVAEIACAVVLTVCAGLLLRSFSRLQAVSLGYQPDRVASAYLRNNYNSPEGYPFWRAVLAVSSSVPGAVSSATSDCFPSTRANTASVVFAGRPSDPGHEPTIEGCWISADYFKTLDVPLVRGRFFSDRDDASAPPVAIINVEAARRLFPSDDPIGRMIAVNYLALGSRPVGPPRMRQIVGVVASFRQAAVDQTPGAAVYLPYGQDESYHVLNSMSLYVRSSGDDPTALAPEIRSRIQSLYPEQPVERVRPLRFAIAASTERRTSAALLMTGFAVLTLCLCGLGIYGVISYVMLQRTREFGIRLALGAQRGDVLTGVLKSGTALVAIGVGLGAGCSLLVAGQLSQLLYETSIADPLVYGGAFALLGAIGIAACLMPAIRASRLDPRSALNVQ